MQVAEIDNALRKCSSDTDGSSLIALIGDCDGGFPWLFTVRCGDLAGNKIEVSKIKTCLSELALWADLASGVNSVRLAPHYCEFDVEFGPGPLGMYTILFAECTVMTILKLRIRTFLGRIDVEGMSRRCTAPNRSARVLDLGQEKDGHWLRPSQLRSHSSWDFPGRYGWRVPISKQAPQRSSEGYFEKAKVLSTNSCELCHNPTITSRCLCCC